MEWLYDESFDGIDGQGTQWSSVWLISEFNVVSRLTFSSQRNFLVIYSPQDPLEEFTEELSLSETFHQTTNKREALHE